MGTRSSTSHALRTFGATSESFGSPAYKDPTEAGTLPRFIETPTATTEQKPKPAEKFVTLPSDAEQSTKRQRQQDIPRK